MVLQLAECGAKFVISKPAFGKNSCRCAWVGFKWLLKINITRGMHLDVPTPSPTSTLRDVATGTLRLAMRSSMINVYSSKI